MRPEAAIDRVAPLDASKHFEQHRRAHLRDRPLANPWKYVLLERTRTSRKEKRR